MDDEPRSHDKEVNALGGETRRLGVICVTFLCNRYLSHEPFCQRELPREGAARAASSRWHERTAARWPPASVENG